MKKIIIALSLLFAANTTFSQDLSESQVPSVIVNDFKQKFPRATDIEWEMDDELYQVEFEVGETEEQKIWYNRLGELVRHEQEISENDLPRQVLAKISSDYSGFQIDDIKKIVKGNVTTYDVELDSPSEEWEVVFSSEGEILTKKED